MSRSDDQDRECTAAAESGNGNGGVTTLEDGMTLDYITNCPLFEQLVDWGIPSRVQRLR